MFSLGAIFVIWGSNAMIVPEMYFGRVFFSYALKSLNSTRKSIFGRFQGIHLGNSRCGALRERVFSLNFSIFFKVTDLH